MVRTPHDPNSDVLDLCCGGKRCPVLRDEGDSIVISDADQTADSIRFTKADAERIVAWLQTRLTP